MQHLIPFSLQKKKKGSVVRGIKINTQLIYFPITLLQSSAKIYQTISTIQKLLQILRQNWQTFYNLNER